MKKNRLTYIKNILIPCLLFSGITGVLTGVLIFLFKIAASFVISHSENIYAFVRSNPAYIPLLLAGIAVVAFIASLILKVSPSCRGGGIPTSIAILRGLVTFSWIKSVFLLFTSALLSYLAGIPLGNEGPSVQMGTAVGRGTVRVFAKNNQAWDRYIMTGGACAGFAAATGAPISGIFFAFEEAHRRFSPMIFMTAAIAVVFGNSTMQLLCTLFSISPTLFDFTIDTVLPLKYMWASLIVGLVCALFATLFTRVYRFFFELFKDTLAKLPLTLKIIIVFVCISLIGLVSAEFLGTGHHIVEHVLDGHGVWYMLLLYLCVRAILLIVANNAGVTGGLFVPSLAFGAMIGAVCGKAMIALHILPKEYYVITVVMGMAAFLSASSRTPITAIVFAIEALCGFANILPIAASVTLAYLTIETIGIHSFTETVIETKVEDLHKGMIATVVDAYMTVGKGSFVIGKEIPDILWPPTCVVLSVKKASDIHSIGMAEGDILHLRYQTYDKAETCALLENLVGKQTNMREHSREKLENAIIPNN